MQVSGGTGFSFLCAGATFHGRRRTWDLLGLSVPVFGMFRLRSPSHYPATPVHKRRNKNSSQVKKIIPKKIPCPYRKWPDVSFGGVMCHTACYVPFSAHVSRGSQYIQQYTT